MLRTRQSRRFCWPYTQVVDVHREDNDEDNNNERNQVDPPELLAMGAETVHKGTLSGSVGGMLDVVCLSFLNVTHCAWSAVNTIKIVVGLDAKQYC